MTNSNTTDGLRDTVRAELPELEQISDPELREKIVEAWAMSLSEYGFKGISELRGSGAPNFLILKRGTQTDHIRGVTLLAIQIADQLCELFPEMDIDRDVLVAGGLLHDVGKPLEYSLENQERWSNAPRAEGWPPTRHSVHGWHICRSLGIPDKVAHICAAHSREGELVVRSLECTIIHYADHTYWNVLKAGGMLEDGDAQWIQDPSRASR